MKIRVVIECGLATVYSDCAQADVDIIDRDVQDEESEASANLKIAQLETEVKNGELYEHYGGKP